MKSEIILGLIQPELKPGDLNHNLQNCISLVREAAKRGAEFIILPEYFMTAGSGLEPADIAETIPGKCTKQFGALAKDLGVYIIPGSIVERDEKSGNLYNTSVLINNLGQIVGSYRKVYLWCTEQVQPGNKVQVFDTPWGPVGLSICWDLAFPDLYRQMATQGARFMVNVAHWCTYDKYGPYKADENEVSQVPDDLEVEARFISHCATARAFENAAVFVFVNSFRTTEDANYEMGCSQIISPFLWMRCQSEKPAGSPCI